MSELIQGVKLKFELPFTLPKPVSFPFESIGDFRPITRIPKYDYSLEKKIMKEIAKQKQEEQFNMLKQAQQQLSMVDLIASRKNRHKGKEPEKADARPSSSGGETRLLKPQSESGTSRLQNSAPAESMDLQSPHQQDVKADTPATTHTTLLATPGDNLTMVPTVKVERPHSAGPGVPTTQSSMSQSSNAAPVHSQATTTTAAAAAARPEAIASSYPTHQIGHAENLKKPPAITPQHPTNMPLGFAIRPAPSQPLRPLAMSGASGSNVGFHSMVDLPLNRPPQQQPQQQQPQPHLYQHVQPRPQMRPVHQQQLTPASTRPDASAFRFSTSFGNNATPTNMLQSSQDSTAMRPVLPPKPDEWKPQSSGSGFGGSSISSAGAPPVPPRRKQSLQNPPAIPPKPLAFSEFDYAADGPSALGSIESPDHVEQLSTLLSMGFSRPQAIHALEMYDYDVNKASNYLIDKA
ncbi:hypothetical protein IWW36_004112 [Coemansia brasiliensis]|uniref:UBA domain-containing protein n=1 Tax=Coemansia brasiliensis TaxID=2650707 RepID=A0A9W8I8X5_9FUNG|nr:hypothetical protein IWW36_004112 [Coemansia brasiliensis]